MSKFTLTIIGYNLDTVVDLSTDGFDETEVFDTEEQATNAWKVRRAQMKDMYIRDGWEIATNDEDNEAWSLRVIREREGREVERMYVAYISRI